jgi:hypothetical protein
LPYQTGSGATTFLAAGTDGYILTQASGVPTWAAAPVTGISITDDTSTNAARYITFTDATTGTETGLDVSSTKLQYNPSTGTVTSEIVAAANGIVINSNTVDTTYSIPSTYNAMSAGPVTVDSGVTVTVPSGSRWVVI